MDRRRIEHAASAYPYLRGLVSVPAGALFVVAALGNWRWGPFAHDWFFVLAIALTVSAAALISRWYMERFGRVTPSRQRQLRAHAVAVAGIAVIVFGSMLLRSRAGWSLDLPVNPVAIFFGALMLAYYAAVAGLRPHHVVIWSALLVAGALPVWTGDDPANIALVMTGVAVMVNGVLDHRALIGLLGPPLTPDHARG